VSTRAATGTRAAGPAEARTTGTAGAGGAPAEAGPDAPADGDAVLPLTAAQSGMWFAQALDPLSPALNTAECLRLDGPLDPGAFAAALRLVTREADSLRIRVLDTPEGPRQYITADSEPSLTVLDLRGTDDAGARVRTWTDADLATPVDLAAGPVFRHTLFRLADERWLWYLRIHHLAMDGFGYSLLVRRTAEVYTALVRGTEPPPRSFGRLADLVADDAAYRASEAFTADRAHWAQVLADRPEAPRLAGRGALPSRTFHRRTAHLAPGVTERVRELADRLRATWPDVLVAAQALYASRATGRSDVVLGLPLMGRLGSVALRVPGMVMNVVPLRLTVTPGISFAGLVRQVVLGVREARRHQRYRYEDIRRDLGQLGEQRGLVGPLVNIMPFDYGVDFAGTPARADNLSAGPVDDLTVGVHDRSDGRGLRIDHDGNPALYDADALAAHQERFLCLVERLTTADPHQPLAAHTIATPDEQALVLEEFNRTEHPVPPTTLIGPIESRAARTPGATALVYRDTTLTYGELNARANRLAHRLQGLGARPGALVAVSVPRVGGTGRRAAGGAEGRGGLSAPRSRVSGATAGVHAPGRGPGVRDRRPRGPSPGRYRDPGGGAGRARRVRVPGGEPGARPHARSSGLRHLHVRFHGPPQGGRGPAPGDRQPAALDAARVRADGRGPGSAEDAVVVRRVGVGVLLAAAGGRGTGRRRTGRAQGPRLSGPADP
jgi:enterobactin synthetase component F